MNPKCPFCQEFDGDSSRPGMSRIIDCDDNFILIPTLGCFCEGYCLYLPKDHKPSFADCTTSELIAADDRLRRIRNAIATEFGSRVILAEHGPSTTHDTPDSERLDCSCIDHAHIHLIPVPSVGLVLQKYVEAGGVPIALSSFSELRQYAGPYIYLNIPSVIGEGPRHMIWDSTRGFTKQFVRKVCADIYGLGPFYNWRSHPFRKKMEVTQRRLRRFFKKKDIIPDDRKPSSYDKHNKVRWLEKGRLGTYRP